MDRVETRKREEAFLYISCTAGLQTFFFKTITKVTNGVALFFLTFPHPPELQVLLIAFLRRLQRIIIVFDLLLQLLLPLLLLQQRRLHRYLIVTSDEAPTSIFHHRQFEMEELRYRKNVSISSPGAAAARRTTKTRRRLKSISLALRCTAAVAIRPREYMRVRIKSENIQYRIFIMPLNLPCRNI